MCAEWDTLAERYDVLVQAYHGAASELNQVEGAEFWHAHERVDDALDRCLKALSVLETHEREHRCNQFVGDSRSVKKIVQFPAASSVKDAIMAKPRSTKARAN